MIDARANRGNGNTLGERPIPRDHDGTRVWIVFRLCDEVRGDPLRDATAGAVFVGGYAAQAAGDYATGSNHVLPTAGAARFRGGLSAADFVRVMSVQRVTREGLARLAPTILPLARAEGLDAHAASVEIRLNRATRRRS